MTNNLPAWDLTELYKDIKDPKIERDLQEYKNFCISFAKKYKGKISSLSSKDFLAMLSSYEKQVASVSKLGSFAHLNMVTQMKNVEAMSFFQNVSEKLTEYSKPLVFFSLEVNKVPELKLKEWFCDKQVEHYRPWIERNARYKKYELSEPVEEVLLEKSMTSSAAWVRLYEETCSKLEYTLDGQVYNDAQISKLLLDEDASIRAKAGHEINRVSKCNADLFSFIYNMVIKDKAIEDEKRGFISPISSRNLSENVSDKTVETLASVVRENYKSISHRFYALKAKWLGVEKITYWDRNAPLPFAKDASYSWDEAVKIVLEAYGEFSPKLHNVAVDFFDNAWIDVPPRDGKRSGAFCAPVSSDSHPYLLLNFMGKRNDVLTLAHELGHGCHHQTRVKNGELNEYSRMTTEEVASVFGEMITFQSMLKKLPDNEEKLALVASKVGDMINTAIRQISFHFFEFRAHSERKDGELSVERLSQIWQEEMSASLGESVIVDDNCKYIWMQVGHFFFLPFYVYAYSFADCLVNSLYKASFEVDDFADKYMEMLSKTAITDYNQLLKPFGLSPEDASFWNKGLSLISGYIDELERLDAKLFA